MAKKSTMIRVPESLSLKLGTLRIYPKEPKADVIKRLLDAAKKDARS